MALIHGIWALVLVGPLPSASSDDVPTRNWPHMRGPIGNGQAKTEGLFTEEFGLDVAWKSPVGSAYSGVAVANGRAITMGSQDGVDAVIALDTETGGEAWRFPLGPTYLGHDGSKDGPLSTPAIEDGVVFALDARGVLHALRVEDGKELWSRDFAEWKAEAPEYGFTTSPLIHGPNVIIQCGGPEGRSICALDRESGSVRWTYGSEPGSYQSPSLMTLAGIEQVVVLGGPRLYALDPVNGDLLWEYRLEGRASAGQGLATAMDANRFFATVSGQLMTFEVEKGEGGLSCKLAGRSRELGRGYAAPVYFDGHFYGLKNGFLTCVNATTGRRVWKSRPPGGSGLLLVDDRLVIFGAQGKVVIARATPEGYVEEARTQALDSSSLIWPSFAAGRVFVRNYDTLAAVSISESRGASTITQSSGANEHAFGRMLASMKDSEDKAQQLKAYLEKKGSLPIVEGEFVHFVFESPSEDVAIAGSMLDGSQADPMERIEGTDFYHKTYRIQPGSRWEYRFQVDYETWHEDPRNERKVPAERGNVGFSEVITEGYRVPTHIQEPKSQNRGTLETYEFESALLDNKRAVHVYLPPGYAESQATYPLLIIHRGPDYMAKGLMTNTLDNVIGNGVEPLVVVFLGTINNWWYEGGGTGTDKYVDMLVQEFVPDLEKRFRLRKDAASRAIMGNKTFGLTSAYAALRYPDVFAKVALQSYSGGDIFSHELSDLIKRKAGPNVRFYVDWNLYSGRNLDRGYDYRKDSRELAESLKQAGYDVYAHEALDGYGWGSFRSRTDRILQTLFPEGS